MGRRRGGRTFDAAAALLKSTDVAFDRAVALKLVPDEVGLCIADMSLQSRTMGRERTLWLELM